MEELAALVDQSLLVADEGPDGEPRCRMLETIRAYALERLAESGEEEAIRRAHVAHFLAVAERAEPELTGPEQATWLARLEAEHDNLRAALAAAYALGAVDQGLRLAAALWRFWWIRGHLAEGRSWLEKLLRGDGPPIVRARALNGAGNLAWAQGDDAAAEAWHEESLALWRRLRDAAGTARALNNLGMVLHERGDHAGARARYEEGLALWRDLGDAWGIAAALNNLGIVLHDLGDQEQARALLLESLALKRSLDDTAGIAATLGNVGEVSAAQGDYATAASLFGESAILYMDLGDRGGLATCLENVAHVVAQPSNPDSDPYQAALLFGAATHLRNSTGVPPSSTDHPLQQQAVDTLRRTLGDAVFDKAWRAGQAATPHEAVAMILRLNAH